MNSFQSLDTPTIALVIFLIATLLAAGMTLLWRWDRTEPGFGYWVAAQWALSLGMLFLFSRAVLPLWISVMLGNAGILAMLVLLRAGSLRFIDRRLPLWPDVALTAAVTAAITINALLDGHIEVRIALVGAAVAVLAVRCASALRGLTGPLQVAARSIQAIMAAVAGLMTIRVAVAALGDAQGDSAFQHGLAHASIFLSVSFAAVAMPFILMIMNSARNMERLQRAHRAAESASETDVLTDLPNRRGLFRRVGDLDGARRIGVCLIDLDLFKQVNDTYGHDDGDRVLRELAGLLAETAPGCLHARLGGEEFVTVVPNGDAASTLALAERLRAAIHASLADRAGLPDAITTSIGTTAGPADRFTELLTTADLALYRAKRAGRDRVLAAGADDAGAAPGEPQAPVRRLRNTA